MLGAPVFLSFLLLSTVLAALGARLLDALRGGDVAGVAVGVVEVVVEAVGPAEVAVAGVGVGDGVAGVVGRGVAGPPPSSSEPDADPEWLLTSVRVTAACSGGADDRTGRCGPGDAVNRMGCVKVTGVAARVTGPMPGDSTACASALAPTFRWWPCELTLITLWPWP